MLSTYKSCVADQFPGKPQERLLEVVVGLGRNVIVLEVLLAVECDGLGLDLALLDVDLVSGQNDGNVLADTDQVTCSLLVNLLITYEEKKKNSGMTYDAS